ncbi:alpha/beta hydrolase [Kocuria marina]|uniref:alpha/beta hydrolase n=1 Tax=Kocuria marina TaxID=223184 RepID=UPI003800C412
MLTYSQLRRSRPGHRSRVREEDSVRHGWVPAGNRWIAVDVHEPTTTERGGTVIVVGSPGRERVTLTRSMIHTARALAAHGWRVVRLDWSGTGQSPTAEEAVDAGLWVDDLTTIRDWASSHGPVHGVGFSLGGTVLAATEDHGWASRLVLAPVSGKQWVRHQSALRRMGGPDLPPRVSEGTELMNLQLSSHGAAALKALPEPADGPDRRIRILSDEEAGALPINVHPRAAAVPARLIATVRTALDAAPAGTTPDDTARPDGDGLVPEQEITVDVAGTSVVLRRSTSGAARRPAIITEPVTRGHDAPGLAFISPGSEVMEASGGLWLRTALLASARGAVCLLAERSDTGELVRSDITQDSNPYAHHTLTESRELVMHLSELTDGPLLGAGICLGAWGLVASAHELPATVSERLTLMVINNVAWQRAPWRYWRQGLRGGPLAPTLPGQDEAAAAPSSAPAADDAPAGSRWDAVLAGLNAYVGTTARTVVRGTRHRARNASPRVNALAAGVGVIDVPQPTLRRLAKIPGLTVDAVFGPADAKHCGVTPQRLGPRSTLTVLDPLDHSLFATESCRRMVDYVLAYVPEV